jgi:hypothetical protein
MILTSPKGQSNSSLSHKDLISSASPGRWGFTVYSTYPITISPSASSGETLNKRVCERFQAYFNSNLRFSVEDLYGEKMPLDIEFNRLPSVSTTEARVRFRAKYSWPEKHEMGIFRNHEHHDLRHGVFVVIDEETMKALLDAPNLFWDFRQARAIGLPRRLRMAL